MNSLSQASTFNASGVNFLSDGNFEEARNAFTNAIHLVKREIAVLQAPSRKRQDPAFPLEAELFQVYNSDNDQSPVFNQSIVIRQPADEALKNESTVQLYSGVIIYNMALTYHIEATETNYEGKRRKSEQLYEMALKLLLSDRSQSSCQQHVSILLPLACCTNLAQLRIGRGSDETAQECLDVAARLISALKAGSANFLNEPMVQGLILSAFFLRSQLIQAAPAA